EIAAQRAARDALEKAKQDPKADNLATDRASAQRRREQVAALLNKNRGYSNYLDDAPMLVNAGFAGPLTYGNDVFVKREAVYRASAEIVPLISDSSVRVVRRALIRIKRTENGSEAIEVQVMSSAPLVCSKADYAPFPELERAREQSRQALGKKKLDNVPQRAMTMESKY